MPVVLSAAPQRATRASSQRRLHPLRAGLLLALIALALPATALADPQAETEPNDNILQLTAVSTAADGVTGTLVGSGDVDWFLVYLRPQRQVRFTFAPTNPDTCTGPNANNMEGALTTQDGQPIGDGYGGGYFDLTWDDSKTWTTTTKGTYGGPSIPALLHVDYEYGGDNLRCDYTFSIADANGNPSDVVDPNPPPIPAMTWIGEPNDQPSQAGGLLAGGTSYTGALETEPDVDYLRLRLAPGRQVAMETTRGSADRSNLSCPR